MIYLNGIKLVWFKHTPRKQFFWYTVKEKISLNWRKFCWFKKIFFKVNKSISLDQRTFFWINETFFNSKKFFLDRISKKLFSQCSIFEPNMNLSKSNQTLYQCINLFVLEKNLFNLKKYLFGLKIFCLNQTNIL